MSRLRRPIPSGRKIRGRQTHHDGLGFRSPSRKTQITRHGYRPIRPAETPSGAERNRRKEAETASRSGSEQGRHPDPNTRPGQKLRPGQDETKFRTAKFFAYARTTSLRPVPEIRQRISSGRSIPQHADTLYNIMIRAPVGTGTRFPLEDPKTKGTHSAEAEKEKVRKNLRPPGIAPDRHSVTPNASDTGSSSVRPDRERRLRPCKHPASLARTVIARNASRHTPPRSSRHGKRTPATPLREALARTSPRFCRSGGQRRPRP